MGQDPAEIRREIEQTREQMGDTVGAIGHRADLPGRAKESISDKTQSLKEKIGGATDRISGATPDSDQVKDNARQAVGVAQENPLGLAVGAAAVGFLAGMLVPSTSVENQRIGPVADEVKDRARETGQQALEHGKQVAQEAAQSAQETARQSAQEHGQQVADTAREQAQQVQQSAQPA